MKKQHLAVLAFWLGLSLSAVLADDAAEKAAGTAALAWLAQIDAANYASSWQEASAYFRGAVTKNDWTDALTGIRKPLGELLSRTLVRTQSASSLPGAPDGNYVVMRFDTNFSNKKVAVETVTLVREKNGMWRAAGYYIK